MAETAASITGPEHTVSGLEFPGCDTVRMTARDYRAFEGRLEYWDRDLGTAWMVRDAPGLAHETPRSLLVAMMARVSLVRGSRIGCHGSVGLVVRDAEGKARRVMQADEVVYLHPMPLGDIDANVVVGEDRLPDVVLEVDNTTDVRRGKLRLYESWGFPEIWVEVPESAAPSRPRGLVPGLTIHVLDEGRYRETETSRAFPGWTSGSIHAGLNDPEFSEATNRELNRLGLLFGAREGRGPDDDVLLGAHRRQARRLGHREGRLEGQVAMVSALLGTRGVRMSVGFAQRCMTLAAESPPEEILEAVSSCVDEADFWRRLGR